MKYTTIENIKMHKASYSEQDKLEFLSNTKASVPRIYKLFGVSGITVLGIVLLLAAFTSVFFKELEVVLFPVFAVSWKVGVVYTLISLMVYGGITLWYHHKHIMFKVCYVYCSDSVPSELDDDVMFVFQTQKGEQFTMMKSQFAYVPTSFTVQLDYIIAFDTVNEQYLMTQMEEA